tara:strand:+ start:587 stop:754 length:168 start_codon:yes stop_codon:yes gene_type:complete
MYKTREDVEAMIEIIEMTKAKFYDFCYWVLDALAAPTPGVIHSEAREELKANTPV